MTMKRSLDEEFLLHRIAKLEAEVEKLKSGRSPPVEAQGFNEERSANEGVLLQRISKLEVEVEKFKNREIHHSKLIRMLAESIEALDARSDESQSDEHFIQRLEMETSDKRQRRSEPNSMPITVEKLIDPKK